MIKLNNKGQSLVMFILILPIIIFILIIVADMGSAMIKKQALDNVNYLTIEYGLEHLDDDNLEKKLIDMLNRNNIKRDEIQILIKDNKIKIIMNQEINGIIAKSFKIFNVNSSYIGYMENNKKIIERV